MPKKCSRCLLDSEVPGVHIEDDGLCSVCVAYDKNWGNWDQIKEKKKLELERILTRAKNKKCHYDALVPISGGKDSTYVLYLCRRQYDLKCLAVTFDNGFLTGHARRNIAKACEILDVDHIYYGLSKPMLMRLYRNLFLKTGFFCPICMRGIGLATYKIQAVFNIPLAITGSSFRTEEYVAPEFFVTGECHFLKNALSSVPDQRDVSNLLQPYGGFVYRLGSFSIKAFLARIIGRQLLPYINIPDYLDWDYDLIYATLTEQLDWIVPDRGAEHSDCEVDKVVHYLRQKKFPALEPERLRFSKLVTAGLLTREEAQKRIEKRKLEVKNGVDLEFLLSSLRISREDLDQAVKEPLRHLTYLEKPKPWLSKFRRIKNNMLGQFRELNR